MSQYHGTVLCLISLLFVSFNVLKNYTQKKIPHTSFPYHYQLRVPPLPARTINLIKKRKEEKSMYRFACSTYKVGKHLISYVVFWSWSNKAFIFPW